MTDICITFNTGFYKKGYLVMKRREIVKNYIKTWFIIDLLASFPYTEVLNSNNDNTNSYSNPYLYNNFYS